MIVFEPGRIGNLTTKNRFVHSSTYEGLGGPDATCTPEMVAYNRKLAEGGVGINEISFAFIHESGRQSDKQLGCHDDAMIPGLRMLTEAHREAGCLSFLQIAHAGPHAGSQFAQGQHLAPTGMEQKKGGLSRTMSKDDIRAAVGWFADAAVRAKESGFDGVQIHAAHGFLVSSFLSPYYNRREDEYGGSVENRARFFIEVLRAVRAAVGPDYPIVTKMNSEDRVEGGLTIEMMAETALLLEQNGIDAIELSAGCNADPAPSFGSSPPVDPQTPEQEGYYREAARLYKATVKKTPLILVGGFRSLAGCEAALQEGLADFIAFSRPLIREPGLVSRWAAGDTGRAKCVSCNLCREHFFSGKAPRLYCVPDQE